MLHARTISLAVVTAVITLSAGLSLAQPRDTTQLPVVPIGQALVDRDGDTVPDLMERDVRVRGVVTVPTGIVSDAYLQAFIQDDTGGIYLFDRRIGEDLKIGDIVEVSGKIDQYRGAVQLINASYRVVGAAAPPQPTPLGIRVAASWDHYGELVSVEGILGESEEQSTILIPLRAIKGQPEGRIDVFIPRKIDRGMLPDDRPPGARVRVVGVVSIRSFDRPYHEGFQVILRDRADLTVLETPTPVWVRDLSIIAITALGLAVIVFALFANHRRRVAHRERELSLVNDLSTAIASPHLDQDALLDAAINLIHKRIAAKGAAIQLIDGHGTLSLSRSKGLSGELEELLRREELPNDRNLSATSKEIEALEQRGYHLLARLPISGRNRSMGFLSVFSDHRITRPDTVAILSTAAGIIGVGLENATMARESEEREAELKQLAITDDLTGLYNRRFLEEYLRIQLAMSHRRREPVAFLALDLDHFKAVNDRYGHEIGDKVLARIGEIIRLTVRTSDLPVRLGGEEFLVVMPQSDADGAKLFAERLLRIIEETEFSHVDQTGLLHVTISAGIAAFPEHGERVRTLMRLADEALYRAKADGRNVVRLAKVVVA